MGECTWEDVRIRCWKFLEGEVLSSQGDVLVLLR